MLGSTVACDLQPEVQSSTTFEHVPLERIHLERRQIGFQPNMVPGPEQSTQRPPVTKLVFNNPIISDEPLKNELDRLMHCDDVLCKDHEHKKSQCLIEYNQEMEKIEKNNDSVHQKEDSSYQTLRELSDLYRKVYVTKAVAEHFHRVFTPSSAAQGRSTGPVLEQPFESSSAAQDATTICHAHRPATQDAMHTDQQQLPAASPGVASLGQYGPVITGSYASAMPLEGAVLKLSSPNYADAVSLAERHPVDTQLEFKNHYMKTQPWAAAAPQVCRMQRQESSSTEVLR